MSGMLSKSFLFPVLAIFLMTSILVPAARATVIDTSSYLQVQSDTNRTAIETLLTREDVRKQLVSLGVAPDDARERVAALTEEELAELQKRMNELPVGSSLLAVLGAVLVVLIVLELIGVTNVFNRL